MQAPLVLVAALLSPSSLSCCTIRLEPVHGTALINPIGFDKTINVRQILNPQMSGCDNYTI